MDKIKDFSEKHEENTLLYIFAGFLLGLIFGFMNAKNCAELLAKPNVDGGLIGGASLKADDFNTIVQAAVNG